MNANETLEQFLMKRASTLARFLAISSFLCSTSFAASIPPVFLLKKTFTVFDVSIERPNGNPVTAGSIDNEFVLAGAAGTASITFEAKVTPASQSGFVGNEIKWTIASLPAGTAISWNNAWPGEPTSGKGLIAIATLTGYPTSNNQFGLKTVTMRVIRGTRTIITKTTDIELFFYRDDVATGRSVPNWFFYWNQTAAGSSNAEYPAAPNQAGETPGMTRWETYSGPRSRVLVGVPAAEIDARRDGSGQTVTGIDLFANTILHEAYHTQQITNNNAQPFFSGITGLLRDAAQAGWSFGSVAFGNSLWNHFTDNNGSNSFNSGDTNLDGDDDYLADSLEPSNAERILCSSSTDPSLADRVRDLECQADLRETSPENTYRLLDWGAPGKQHRGGAYND